MKQKILTLGVCLAVIFTVAFGARFYCANADCVGFSWGENDEPITIVECAGELFECYDDTVGIGDCKVLFDNNGTNNVRDDKIVAIF